MKWLRKFNESLFIRLDSDDYHDDIVDKEVDMSIETFNKIVNHINIKCKYNYDNKHHIGIGSTFYKNIYGVIIETNDEWFWVWIHLKDGKEISFKCDQTEGLYQCLKSINLYK